MIRTPIDLALNEDQLEAIMAPDGPLLIEAGPGAGKTRTLTYRVARLVERGYDPSRILVTTFTRKAAQEMKERLSVLLGDDVDLGNIGTVHSRCLRFMRAIGPEKFGLRDHFEIASEVDARNILRRVKADILSGDIRNDFSYLIRNTYHDLIQDSEMFAAISLASDMCCSPSDFFRLPFYGEEVSNLIVFVAEEYHKAMLAANKIDFGMMQRLVVSLLKRDPVVLTYIRRRFDHVLIDEYQDTNKIQFELFNMLAEEHRNISVVGDIDQSIYAFRGAVPEYFLNFKKVWSDARVVRLNMNYRSQPAIIRAAANVITRNNLRSGVIHEAARQDNVDLIKSGSPVTLFCAKDPDDEARTVLTRIEKLIDRGIPFEEIAVLYRLRFLSNRIERELRARSIPHVVIGSMPFYNRKEIMDVLAWMRLLVCNDNEQAFERAVKSPPCGIGAVTINKLIQYAKSNGISIIDACKNARKVDGIRGRQLVGIKLFRDNLGYLSANRTSKTLVEDIITRTGYLKFVETDDSAVSGEEGMRVSNIMELADNYSRWVTEFWPNSDQKNDALTDFINALPEKIVDGVTDVEGNETKKAVVLSTIHASKGREFKAVFLIGCEEGIMPMIKTRSGGKTSVFKNPDGGLEEERRICFVGMTRAKDLLHMSYTGSRLNFATNSFVATKRSRYIDEICRSGLCRDPDKLSNFFVQ